MPKLNKLLSNLPFNPSLIGQISFYAKRLKKEASVRRLGFFMLLLAMLVQLFAAMSPPRATFAHTPSDNDLIRGGFTEQGHAVLHCLNGSNEDFSTILSYYGISCTDLDYGHASVVTIHADDFNGQLYSMGRKPYGIAGEQPVSVPGANNGRPLYVRYLWGWPGGGGTSYQALYMILHGQTFFILFDCGNLVSVGLPQPAPATPTPTPPPPPPAPPVDSPSIGSLDVVDCKHISGWAFDQSKPTATIEVHIYIDGKGAATTPADKVRTDVGAAYPGAGNNHGFSIPTPASIKNTNSHKVDAYAIGIDANGAKNNVNPLIGSKTVTLGTCTTPLPSHTPGNASCSNLKATAINNKTYSFVATTVGEDYVVKSYSFTFGDGASKKVTSTLFVGSAEHTYTKTGKYTAKVSIAVNVQGASGVVAKTLSCQTSFTISETAKPPTTKPCDETTASEDLKDCLVPHKSAKNLSKGGSDANGTTAQAGDIIEYTLTLKNTAKLTVPKAHIQESISDILVYADVTNYHGGSIDKFNYVNWPEKSIKPGATITAMLTVKIKDPIPDTPMSPGDPGQYDHKLTNVYGDTVNISLPGDVITVTQTVNNTLPNTGPGTSVAIIVGLTIVVGYFFARSRLLSEEIDLVRSDYAATGGL